MWTNTVQVLFTPVKIKLNFAARSRMKVVVVHDDDDDDDGN